MLHLFIHISLFLSYLSFCLTLAVFSPPRVLCSRLQGKLRHCVPSWWERGLWMRWHQKTWTHCRSEPVFLFANWTPRGTGKNCAGLSIYQCNSHWCWQFSNFHTPQIFRLINIFALMLLFLIQKSNLLNWRMFWVVSKLIQCWFIFFFLTVK